MNTGSSSAVSVGAAAGELSLDGLEDGGAVDAELEAVGFAREGGVQFRAMGASEDESVDGGGKVLKEDVAGAGFE